MYSQGQELFYKFVSKITNKLVKQLLSMTVSSKLAFPQFSLYVALLANQVSMQNGHICVEKDFSKLIISFISPLA